MINKGALHHASTAAYEEGLTAVLRVGPFGEMRGASKLVRVQFLAPEDRAAWEVLARGYKTFYRESEPDEAYEQTWQRLAAGTELHGLGARLDGRLVGIAHYLFHPAVWSGEACYLQDLFTDEAARGRGVARALIEGVAAAARRAGGGPVLLAHPGEQHPGPRALRQGGALHRVHPLRVSPVARPEMRTAAALTPSMNSPMPNR